MPYPALEILDRVPSTMDMARTRIQQGVVRLEEERPTPFTGLLAREQTAGRGQRGRVWNSRAGASLCATFYFRHGFDLPAELGVVALLAGVAAAATLTAEAAASDSTADIGLKWPNDILINGKKAGGILIETTRTPDGKTVALIGIGINLSAGSFPPELASTATTLEAADICASDPTLLAASLAEALQEQADLFQRYGQTDLMARWRTLDRTVGRRFHTERDSVLLTGIAEGIDENGRLLLRLSDQTCLAVGSASTLQERVS
ncbi:MAG: Biotin-(acetyl-CoA carboxylase) ligase [Chthonomonadaceae bacterium]|nr:Biotin-(acetyl-CoA carboxylase) ligase [Chthonomonadaceae bacterium]